MGSSDSKLFQGAVCLVTGGAGFIGSHLVERLLSEGAKVRVLDDLSTGSKANLDSFTRGAPFELIEGTVTDPRLVTRALAGVQYVFHLAALPAVARSVEDPWETNQVNVDGTLLLLDQSRKLLGLKRFVFTSSSSVYGDTPTLPKSEEAAGHTLSPYALQKWTGENYVRLFHSLYGFPGISVRPFNVFGPRQSPDNQYAAVIPLFIKCALEGKPIRINGDGKQTRDFTHVANMVEVFVRAALTERADALGKAFNAGAGGRFSVLELAEQVLELTASGSKIEHGPARVGDIRDSFADLRRSQEYLGYRPRVSFTDGLRMLVEHQRKST